MRDYGDYPMEPQFFVAASKAEGDPRKDRDAYSKQCGSMYSAVTHAQEKFDEGFHVAIETVFHPLLRNAEYHVFTARPQHRQGARI